MLFIFTFKVHSKAKHVGRLVVVVVVVEVVVVVPAVLESSVDNGVLIVLRFGMEPLKFRKAIIY